MNVSGRQYCAIAVLLLFGGIGMHIDGKLGLFLIALGAKIAVTLWFLHSIKNFLKNWNAWRKKQGLLTYNEAARKLNGQ